MVYVENNHPAIISRDMFYQAKAEMARRASKRKVMQKTGKDVSAKFEDGILKLSLPKMEQKQLPESTSIAIE